MTTVLGNQEVELQSMTVNQGSIHIVFSVFELEI